MQALQSPKNQTFLHFSLQQRGEQRGEASGSKSSIPAAHLNNDTNKAEIEEASVNVSLRVELLRSMRTSLLKRTDEALKKIESAASAPAATTRKKNAATAAARRQQNSPSLHNNAENTESFHNQQIFKRMKSILTASDSTTRATAAVAVASGVNNSTEAATAQEDLSTFLLSSKTDILDQLQLPLASKKKNSKNSLCLDLERELSSALLLPNLHHHLNTLEETIVKPALRVSTTATSTDGSVTLMLETKEDAAAGDLLGVGSNSFCAMEMLVQQIEELKERGILVMPTSSSLLLHREESENVELERGVAVETAAAAVQRRVQEEALHTALFAFPGNNEDYCQHHQQQHFYWPDEITIDEEEDGQQQQEPAENNNNNNENFDTLNEEQQPLYDQEAHPLLINPPPPAIPHPPQAPPLRRVVPNFAAHSRQPLLGSIETPCQGDLDMEDAIKDFDDEEEHAAEQQNLNRPVLRAVIIPERRQQLLQPQHAQHAALDIRTVQPNHLDSQLENEENTTHATTTNAALPSRLPAAPPCALPTTTARLLNNQGLKLTLQWNGPIKDPLALRPSLLLSQWKGNKPRWKPQRRVEDLLVVSSSQQRNTGVSSSSGDIASLMNLAPIAINNELFKKQMLLFLGSGGGGSDGGRGSDGGDGGDSNTGSKGGCAVGRTMAESEGEEGDWYVWKHQAVRIAAAKHLGGGAVGLAGAAVPAVRDAWDLLEEEQGNAGVFAKEQQQMWAGDDAWWDSEDEEENKISNEGGGDGDGDGGNCNGGAVMVEGEEEDGMGADTGDAKDTECLIEVDFEDEEEEGDQFDDDGGGGSGGGAVAAVREEEADVAMQEVEREPDKNNENENNNGSVKNDEDDFWACFNDDEEELGDGDGAGENIDGDGFTVDVVMECDDNDDEADVLAEDYEALLLSAGNGGGRGGGGGGLVEIDYEDEDLDNYDDEHDDLDISLLKTNKHHHHHQKQQQQLKALDRIRESALKEWRHHQHINALGNVKLIRPALLQALVTYQQQQQQRSALQNNRSGGGTSTTSRKSVLLSVLSKKCATILKNNGTTMTNSTNNATAIPFVAALSAMLSLVHTANTGSGANDNGNDDSLNQLKPANKLIGPLKLKETKDKKDVEISWPSSSI